MSAHDRSHVIDHSSRNPAHPAPAGASRRLLEAAIVLAVFVAMAYAAWSTQHVRVTNWWDADEYFRTTEQLAAGQTPTRAAPYVYRLAAPWIVAMASPANIAGGFLVLNLLATAASTLLLLAWLRRFVAASWIRVALTALFVITWHAPTRFVFYYPVYVDPLLFPFLLGGLILTDRITREGTEPGLVASLTGVVIAGTFVREVMLIVPVALLLSGRRSWRHAGLWAPLVAGAVVVAITHALVQPRATDYSFAGAALQQVRTKPLFTWVLAWFITYGPLLSVLMFGWRTAAAVFRDRAYLAWYVLAFTGLSYVGGQDTERLLYWSMPGIYAVMACAIDRNRHALHSTYLVGLIVVTQLLSARVFWSIPSPSLGVPEFSQTPRNAWSYGIVNRLLIVDDFHWNLYSNFGSRSFHALQLALYVALAAVMCGWMGLIAKKRKVVRAQGFEPWTPAV